MLNLPVQASSFVFKFVAVKRGNVRGELFNTSFLLLCHIAQVYGRKVGLVFNVCSCSVASILKLTNAVKFNGVNNKDHWLPIVEAPGCLSHPSST